MTGPLVGDRPPALVDGSEHPGSSPAGSVMTEVYQSLAGLIYPSVAWLPPAQALESAEVVVEGYDRASMLNS